MFKFLKNMFSKGEKKMTNVSNLKNLKQNADKAQQDFENELKRINDTLPEGVTIEWEGAGVTETLVDITNKNQIERGDVIRFVGNDIACLTHGRDYRVTRVDSHGDAQIIDDDGDEFDTCGATGGRFKKVTTSRSTGATRQHNWIDLTGSTRSQLRVGSIVRVVSDARLSRSITLNKEYTVNRKPDADGRFIDDDGNSRDTVSWTVPDHYGNAHMQFRNE